VNGAVLLTQTADDCTTIEISLPYEKGPTNFEKAGTYGVAHQAARKRWGRLVRQGRVSCARCGQLIAPGSTWELDHADDGHGYLGPSHRRCNRAAGAVKTNVARASALRASSAAPIRAPAPRWSRC